MRKNLLGSLVQFISRPPLDRAHGRPFFPRCRVKTRCFLIKASNKKDVNALDKSTIVHEPVNRGVDWSRQLNIDSQFFFDLSFCSF